MKSSNKIRSLFQFENPGVHELARLRDILEAMDVAVPKRPLEFRAPADAALEGTLDEIIERLARVLKDDFANNTVKQRQRSWGFEYFVSDDTSDKGATEIYTRLFNPNDPMIGSAFYGRTVRRISENSYLLWVDDEPEIGSNE
jgi:hypothetical protein